MRKAGAWVFRVLVLAVFTVIVAAPLVYAVFASVRVDGAFSFEAYTDVLTQERQWALFARTLGVSAATAVLSTAFGVVTAFALEYANVPGRRLLWYVVAAPLLIPTYIFAVAWIDLLGPMGLLARAAGLIGISADMSLDVFGWSGVVFVSALAWYPIPAFATLAGLRRLDRNVEDAALLHVGNWRSLAGVTFPLVSPYVALGALVVFIVALTAFATPSLLQVNVYALEIYAAFNAFHDVPRAVAQSTPLVVSGMAALLVWGVYALPRMRRMGNAGMGRKQLLFGVIPRWVSAGFVFALVFISVVLPVTSLVFRALPLSTFAEVWQTAREEIVTSLVVAGTATAVAIAVAFVVAALRFAPWIRWAAAAVAVIAFLVSGPVFGLGLVLAWNHAGWRGAVYDTPAILVLVAAGRYFFVALFGAVLALRRIPKAQFAAADLGGVPRWRQSLGIALPLAAPLLTATAGLVFILALGEADASVMVAPPGYTTLPVRIFTLMHYGPSELVAALSLLVCAGVVAGGVVAAAVYGIAQKRFRIQHA